LASCEIDHTIRPSTTFSRAGAKPPKNPPPLPRPPLAPLCGDKNEALGPCHQRSQFPYLHYGHIFIARSGAGRPATTPKKHKLNRGEFLE